MNQYPIHLVNNEVLDENKEDDIFGFEDVDIDHAVDLFDELDEAARQHEEEVDGRRVINEDDEEEKEENGIRFHKCSDREVKSLTGFNTIEFTSLADTLNDSLIPPSVGKRGRKPTLIRPADRLLVLLTWLRHAEKFRRLGSMFGIGKTQVYKLVMEVLKHVNPAAAMVFIRVIPMEEQKRNGRIFREYPSVACVIDTKVVNCTKPASSHYEAKKYFNFKNNKYGIKTLTIHATDGTAMYCSSSKPASVADSTMCSENETKQVVSNLFIFNIFVPFHLTYNRFVNDTDPTNIKQIR